MYFLGLILFITYEEQHNKGHSYRTIYHVYHDKIVCPLGSFVVSFLLGCRKSTFFFL